MGMVGQRIRSYWRYLLLAVLGFTLGSATIAMATVIVPSSNGTVRFCINNATGIVRAVSEGTACITSTRDPLLNETAVVVPVKGFVDTSVADETAARKAADAALATSITTESNRAQAAETGIGSNVTAEVAARKQADTDTLSAAKQYSDSAVAGEVATR